jgi:hypothetical protein
MTTTPLIASIIMSLRPRLLDTVSVFALVDAVAQRYQFKTVPTPDQLSAGPANFHFGKIECEGRTIIIEQLLVTYVDVRATSVGATTKTSTDDAAFFLSDLVEFVRSEFRLDTSRVYPDYFHSILELVFERGLSFPDFRNLGELITGIVTGYGFQSSAYELSAFHLYVDQTIQNLPRALPFTLERRAGAVFSENKYFSQAPLKTEDHKRVLLEIERSFSVAPNGALRPH